MKLNYKRTLCVGFAFFLIMVFWQAYDTIIPKILTDKFGMSQTASGFVMALDNLLGLFLLPLFGAISDRCSARLGKRTPFILVGTVVAAVLFVCLSFVDGAQLAKLADAGVIDSERGLATIYEAQKDAELMTPEGDRFVLSELYTEEEFTAIRSAMDGEENPAYTNYVVPARQAYAWSVTKGAPGTLVVFMVILLLVLVAMAIFRSPAVALMPDVTIKPLRSKANAVINLMGSAGGILVLILGLVFATSSTQNAMMRYTVFFSVIAFIMLAALCIFMLTVREPKFALDMQRESKRYGIDEGEDDGSGSRALSKPERKSLIFILLSVMLWYMGYNAVTSKYSVYAGQVLGLDYNLTLMIAQAAAIVAYLPVGVISSKIGRKKAILAGVVMLALAFGCASLMRRGSSVLVMDALFALAGVAWATINVNSFPMVVETSRGSDIGRYTGFYYTASMAAQTATPMISGFFMDHLGMTTLFPYAAAFVLLALVTMLMVHHGDNKPIAKKGLEAFNVED